MRKIFYLILTAILFIGSSPNAFSQSKQEKKYTLRAKEVEEEILGQKDAFFTSHEVPAIYSNASAVILAKKVELFSDLKSKVKFSLFYGKSENNTIRYALTIREKIRLQDKSALADYAEFTFNKIRNQSSFYSGTSNTFYGISVIKPDGKINKIDIDAEAVNAADEDEKDKFKLAIPGLEIGDIIDIYSRVEKEATNDNPIEALDIVMGGNYPIVSYSLNTKIRNDFAVVYTTDNGAPDPAETRDDEFIYLKLNFQNVNKSPGDLWVYEKRELPVFKIHLFPVPSSKKVKPNVPVKGQVVKGYPKAWLDEIWKDRISLFESGSYFYSDLLIMLKQNLKKFAKEKKWKTGEKDSIINYIYYYGRFAMLYDYMTESKIQIGLERNHASVDYKFYAYLVTAFRQADIEFDLILTIPRTKGTIHNIVAENDFFYLIRAKGEKQDYFLFPPNMYSGLNSIPSFFEGQESFVYKFKPGKSVPGASEVERLPQTKALYNASMENLNIRLEASNPLVMKVDRKKTVSGNLAYDYQVNLSLFEEYVDSERSRLGERSFREELMARNGKKRGTQLLEEYELAFAVARQKRMELAKEEIENTFEIKPNSLDKFAVLQAGNRHNQRAFIFEESFTLDGLIKKAGPNYIVEIGKLLSSQVQVKNEQRQRHTNIHLPFARTFQHQIYLELPEGFSAEGINELNKNVENETGRFVSTARMEGSKLVFEVEKTYQRIYEPVSNWSQMIEFLDAAYEISQQKILIKKL